MTLKNIIEKNSKEDILAVLYDMYPECREQEEEYESVYEFVKAAYGYPVNDFVIRIGLVDPSHDEDYEDGVDEEAYLTISGYSEKEALEFALGFTKWEEWANAEIEIEADLEIDLKEIGALCIYEMTFYGFDQETIQKELEDLEKGLTNAMYH